jgi:hypothetical protein
MTNQRRKLGVLEVKQAFFADKRFRDLFPELQKEIDDALRDPGCSCNRKLYDRFFEHPDRLARYFPDREIQSLQEQVAGLAKNNWTVINCKCGELEVYLRRLPPGRKQVAVARDGDQCTAVINELDVAW